MEQDDIVLAHAIEGREHIVKADTARFGVEIGVGRDLEAGLFGHRLVVGPGGIGNPDRGVGIGALQKHEQHPEGTRTAGGLRGAHAVGRNRVAERELDHGAGEALVAGHPDIGLGFGGRENAFLGFFDSRHDGRIALVVLIDADAEVDLAGPVVGGNLGHQCKDLVLRGLGKGLEHSHSRNWEEIGATPL